MKEDDVYFWDSYELVLERYQLLNALNNYRCL